MKKKHKIACCHVYAFRKDKERQTGKERGKKTRRNPMKSLNPKLILLLTTPSICLRLNKLHESATTFNIFTLCNGC